MPHTNIASIIASLLTFCLLALNPVHAHPNEERDWRIGCVAPICQIVTSTQAQYKLMVQLPATGLPLNDYVDLDLTVLNQVGQLVVFPVQLEVDAGMPAHHHGMNVKPVVKEIKQGIFRAEGLLFHMAGHWEITVVIKRGMMRDRVVLGVEVQ